MSKHTPKFWLWPDHVISRTESRDRREEHNATVNAHIALLKKRDDLLAAGAELVRVLDALGWANVASDWPVVTDAAAAIESAIDRASGGAP